MSKEIPTLYRQFTAALQRLDPSTGIRFATFATTSPETGPSARMIVVRSFDEQAMTLTIHTNANSGKCSEIAADPRGELVFWDADARLQVRARVTLAPRAGTRAEWAETSAPERMNYAQFPAPGAPLQDPSQVPVPEPENLVIITAEITALDVLQLGRSHHIRAEYIRDDGFKGRWIGP